MLSPVADDPTYAALGRREMSPKISTGPREGGGGGVGAVVPSPTRVCPSGRPAGARDACRRSPFAPPCPAVPPEGSEEGGKGWPGRASYPASAPRLFLVQTPSLPG